MTDSRSRFTRLVMFFVGDRPEVEKDQWGAELLASRRVPTDDGFIDYLAWLGAAPSSRTEARAARRRVLSAGFSSLVLLVFP